MIFYSFRYRTKNDAMLRQRFFKCRRYRYAIENRVNSYVFNTGKNLLLMEWNTQLFISGQKLWINFIEAFGSFITTLGCRIIIGIIIVYRSCLLYTSDAADE